MTLTARLTLGLLIPLGLATGAVWSASQPDRSAREAIEKPWRAQLDSSSRLIDIENLSHRYRQLDLERTVLLVNSAADPNDRADTAEPTAPPTRSPQQLATEQAKLRTQLRALLDKHHQHASHPDERQALEEIRTDLEEYWAAQDQKNPDIGNVSQAWQQLLSRLERWQTQHHSAAQALIDAPLADNDLWPLISGTLLLTALATGLILLETNTLALLQPLKQARQEIRALIGGHYDRRLPITDLAETDALMESIDELARYLVVMLPEADNDSVSEHDGDIDTVYDMALPQTTASAAATPAVPATQAVEKPGAKEPGDPLTQIASRLTPEAEALLQEWPQESSPTTSQEIKSAPATAACTAPSAPSPSDTQV